MPNIHPPRAGRSQRKGRRESPAPWGTATLFAIPAFAIFHLVATVLWKAPAWIALVYVAASIVTFLAYAGDKAAATRGAWRTKESTLHMLSLAGGWPGALLAQQFLRHKSSKAEFRAAFWVTVVLNAAAFAILCPPLRRTLLSA